MTFRAVRLVAALCTLSLAAAAAAQTPPAVAAVAKRRIEATLKQVVTWRRDFHQHPELGMHETRTSGIIADQLPTRD